MINIGLLDDDKTHLQMLELALMGSESNWSESVKISSFMDGASLVESLKCTDYDCLVLDRHVIDVGAESIIKSLRRVGSQYIPIMVVTSNKSFQGAAQLLEIGADDYMQKPFNPAELLLRVKRIIDVSRLLAQTSSKDLQKSSNLQVLSEADISSRYGIQFDPMSMTVNHAYQLIKLTDLEYRLAKLFFSNVGIALSKEDIFKAIWPKGLAFDKRLLSTHIFRIREKVDLCPSNNWVLRVIYGFGYRLDHSSQADLKQDDENELNTPVVA